MAGKIAIIAALEREIAHFVKGWGVREVVAQSRRVKLYQKDNLIVAVGGIGAASARIAADTAYRAANSEVRQFISAGLAGALAPELNAGDIFRPAIIIDEADGLSLETAAGGKGILVSTGTIAELPLKHLFAQKHAAQAVDMEAYAVADVARIYRVPFIAIKAISDELDFPLPPLGRFVTDSGEFQTPKFALYAALRPWMWLTVIKLGANSAKATMALNLALNQELKQELQSLTAH